MTFVLKMLRQASVLLVIFALSGCYLPLQFDVRLELTRTGFYDMTYDGYVVWVPLYEGLQSGKIPAEKEAAYRDKIQRDLARDPAFKETTYVEKGAFKVKWRRTGDLFKSRMVTFIRRNERMISLKYLRTTGEILIQGAIIAKGKAAKLVQAGLNVQGRLRVITDATVADHNADEVTGEGKKTYTWIIKSIFDTAPRMTISVN